MNFPGKIARIPRLKLDLSPFRLDLSGTKPPSGALLYALPPKNLIRIVNVTAEGLPDGYAVVAPLPIDVGTLGTLQEDTAQRFADSATSYKPKPGFLRHVAEKAVSSAVHATATHGAPIDRPQAARAKPAPEHTFESNVVISDETSTILREKPWIRRRGTRSNAGVYGKQASAIDRVYDPDDTVEMAPINFDVYESPPRANPERTRRVDRPTDPKILKKLAERQTTPEVVLQRLVSERESTRFRFNQMLNRDDTRADTVAGWLKDEAVPKLKLIVDYARDLRTQLMHKGQLHSKEVMAINKLINGIMDDDLTLWASAIAGLKSDPSKWLTLLRHSTIPLPARLLNLVRKVAASLYPRLDERNIALRYLNVGQRLPTFNSNVSIHNVYDLLKHVFLIGIGNIQANATGNQIRLNFDPESYKLTFFVKGIGLGLERVRELSKDPNHRWGIITRIYKKLGWECGIASRPGLGFQLSFSIPPDQLSISEKK